MSVYGDFTAGIVLDQNGFPLYDTIESSADMFWDEGSAEKMVVPAVSFGTIYFQFNPNLKFSHSIIYIL